MAALVSSAVVLIDQGHRARRLVTQVGRPASAPRLERQTMFLPRALNRFDLGLVPCNPLPGGRVLAATMFAHESAAFGVHVLAGAGGHVRRGCRAGVGSGRAEEAGQSGRGNPRSRPAAAYASTASGTAIRWPRATPPRIPSRGRRNTGVPDPEDVPPAVATTGTTPACCPGPTARCVRRRAAR